MKVRLSLNMQLKTRKMNINLEGRVEVLDIDVLVGSRLALAPQQQPLFGGHLLHADVLDGEAQDDGPDHTQSHLKVAIHDFCKGRREVR